MKAWVAVLVLFVAVAAVVAVVLFLPPAQRPPRPAPVKPGPTSAFVTQAPAVVVVSYLSALAARDYRTAYGHLSRESQGKHPYDDFVSLNETKGMTEYDLSTATEEQGEDGHMTVAVRLKEDPATAGIRVVKEGGTWKVVFLGGIPSYPYP